MKSHLVLTLVPFSKFWISTSFVYKGRAANAVQMIEKIKNRQDKTE